MKIIPLVGSTMWSSVRSLQSVAVVLHQRNGGWKGREKVGLEMDCLSGTEGLVQEPQPGQSYCLWSTQPCRILAQGCGIEITAKKGEVIMGLG